MPAGKATIDWDGYELVVKFEPFRPDIVAEIKASIPQHSRRWSAGDKCWYVSTRYLEEVCTIFEVFEYALRDYTGDDPQSKLRQAGLRAEREARQDTYAKEKAERIRREEREAEIEEERRRTAEEAKRKKYGQAYGGTEYNTNQDGPYKNKDTWRKRFFAANPSLGADDFEMWWSFYLLFGREQANRFFQQSGQASKRKRYKFGGEYSQNSSRNGAISLDHYTLLGIVRTCSEAEFKTAYRQKAMQYHPDRNPGDKAAEDMMKKVNAAQAAIKAERGW